jgi:hypothetical protein
MGKGRVPACATQARKTIGAIGNHLQHLDHEPVSSTLEPVYSLSWQVSHVTALFTSIGLFDPNPLELKARILLFPKLVGNGTTNERQ